ncbi:MAG: hypothetical protein AAGB31_16010, partial [Bdellovibrio sp.]
MKSTLSSLVFWFYKWLLVPLVYILLQLLRPFLQGKLREMIEDKNRSFSHLKNPAGEADIIRSRP